VYNRISSNNVFEHSFYERHSKYKKPLEKIINNMLNKCKYINNESLERHNWGGKTEKLKTRSPALKQDNT
jgi:hypothetical protein